MRVGLCIDVDPSPDPHLALRATFSRWEKGKEIVPFDPYVSRRRCASRFSPSPTGRGVGVRVGLCTHVDSFPTLIRRCAPPSPEGRREKTSCRLIRTFPAEDVLLALAPLHRERGWGEGRAVHRRRSVPRPSSGASRHLLPMGEGKIKDIVPFNPCVPCSRCVPRFSPSPFGRGVGVRVGSWTDVDEFTIRRRSVPRPSSGASRHLLPVGEGKTERGQAAGEHSLEVVRPERRPKAEVEGPPTPPLRLRSLRERSLS